MRLLINCPKRNILPMIQFHDEKLCNFQFYLRAFKESSDSESLYKIFYQKIDELLLVWLEI